MLRMPRLLVAGRILAGLSQRELAQAAGISVSVLQAIEQGKSDPRLSTVLALIDALRQHDVQLISENDRLLGCVAALRGIHPGSSTDDGPEGQGD
jgi:predicted transcriptional regulator